jgi:VCBS repeat-containing protein
VGAPLVAQYGTLVLRADGSYAYTVDGGNAAVKNLYAGQSLVEVFSYTITDADGNSATARLTITILGPDTRTPENVFHGLSTIDPPVIYQPFQPALYVQFAVQDSAEISRMLSAQMGDGLGIPFGAEIQSDLAGLSQDMTNAQHVSRDGVAFSKQLLAEGQSRARSLGNSLVLGAQTLFDDFSPFGPKPVAADTDGDGGTDNAPPAAPPAANPPPAAAPTAAWTPRGAPAFSEQLREGRGLLHGTPREAAEPRPTVKVARARPAANA